MKPTSWFACNPDALYVKEYRVLVLERLPDGSYGSNNDRGAGMKQVFVMRVWLLLPLVFALPLRAGDACFTIHGRAHLYGGDGQLRIWHVGTHHDYEPDDSSRARVEQWLMAGVKEPERSQLASPASSVNLFADFVICPVEPFKKGSVQKAKVVNAEHRHYVPAK